MSPIGPDAFERLYAEHAQALYGFLSYRTNDRVLAEDLLADTFERALRARRGFDRRKASEKTWLYAIALNCLRDHLRRTGSEQRALAQVTVAVGVGARDQGAGDGERAFERVLERDRLQTALAALGDPEREAIALRFGAEMTVPEIAKLVKEPLSTVEGRVYKALRKLRGAID
jgi:RNA polymerase sigma factor (sigma-70 family)